MEPTNITPSQENISDNPQFLPSRIKHITKKFSSIKLHSDEVTCILELQDKRIVTGSSDGSISISLVNYILKQWTQSILLEHAHHFWVRNFCELSNNRLVSCSDDHSIRIWDTSSITALVLIKKIHAHEGRVFRIIPLINNRLASCSESDSTIKLWNTISYENIPIPFENQKTPTSILQLKHQNEILCISCYNNDQGYLIFYNSVSPYEQKGNVIEGVFTVWRYGMIELNNGHIVISSTKGWVDIVDPVKCVKIGKVAEKGWVYPVSSCVLCLLGDDSFICGRYGYFCQVCYKDDGKYRVIYGVKEKRNELRGEGGIVIVGDGRYFIVDTGGNKKNVNVFRFDY